MKNIEKKFRNGNRKAFELIYDQFSANMYGICLRYSKNEVDAQDILQESFFKIYKNRKQYNLDHAIGSWIKTIVVNTAINYLKSRSKFLFIEETNEYYVDESESEIEDLNQMKEDLLEVLQQLPDGYRTIFNLFVIENLTHKEISEYLNITESTSKSQLFKAKKMIKKKLQTHYSI